MDDHSAVGLDGDLGAATLVELQRGECGLAGLGVDIVLQCLARGKHRQVEGECQRLLEGVEACDVPSAVGSLAGEDDISAGVAGPLGAILAVFGVIVCPITSGDTALRSARMMIQDESNHRFDDRKYNLSITCVLIIPIVLLCSIDFTVLWNYFSWLNQMMACVMLWTATVFLLRTSQHRKYALITALPAVFMTMIVSTFILHSSLGLALDYNLSVMIGLVFTVTVSILFAKYYVIRSNQKARTRRVDS